MPENIKGDGFTPEKLEALFNLPSESPAKLPQTFEQLSAEYEESCKGWAIFPRKTFGRPFESRYGIDAGPDAPEISEGESKAAEHFDQLIYALTATFNVYAGNHDAQTLEYLLKLCDKLSERANEWARALGHSECAIADPLASRRNPLLSFKAGIAAAFVIFEAATSGPAEAVEDLRVIAGSICGDIFQRWYRQPQKVR